MTFEDEKQLHNYGEVENIQMLSFIQVTQRMLQHKNLYRIMKEKLGNSLNKYTVKSLV